MQIKSLKGIEFSRIHKAFTKAFIDYELPPMSIDQLKQMVTRRGLSQNLSMGCFVNGELVSFTLNGIGECDGKLTAYDTGTATVKEFRGQGLAKKIFNESVPVLKNAGVSQYLLEVLQHNDKAVNLYKGVGFRVTREFNYFVGEIKNLNLNSGKYPQLSIKKIVLPNKKEVDQFWNFKPAWQNSIDSVFRTPQSFVAYGAFKEEHLIGYGITEFESGDITQLAVHKSFRRQGVGSTLLKQLIAYSSIPTIKVINTQSSDLGMVNFLKSFNLELTGKQFEMIKKH